MLMSFRPLLCGLLLFFGMGASFVTGCSRTADLDGVWYEQGLNGGTITIDGANMTYARGEYSDTTKFSVKLSAKKLDIIPKEEYFSYVDIYYDYASGELIAYTWPHMDGDGGHHKITFLKTEYVAPPPPVYGETTDSSDPDAPKEFADYTVRTLTLDVIEPIRDNGDMAPEPPTNGSYHYELDADEGVLRSDFCQDIPVSDEWLEGLAGLLKESGLPETNGIDVWTAEMPEDTECYDLEVTFASGEVLHSRANGPNIPVPWYIGGRELHIYLYDAFLEAGYNMWTGEFHATTAMKRLGRPREEAAAYSVSHELIHTERQGTAYDYLVYSEYPVFTVTGDAPELQRALDTLSEYYKDLAAKDLEYDDSIMAEVPKSVWKNEDHRTSYSFYAPTGITNDDLLFRFQISEGHLNCFGLGVHGYGEYPYWRFIMDPATGEILSAADLFVSPEALEEALFSELKEYYGTSGTYGEYILSEEFGEMLREGIVKPEYEGGFKAVPGYDALRVGVPIRMEGKDPYSHDVVLYYDAIQDILNDRYCSEW